MNQELKEKLQSLKVDTPVKKKKCTECKKKKQPVTKLPDVIEQDIYIPTKEDIMLAYVELGNTVQNKKEFINKVYNFLFNEDFNFGCQGCVNQQTRRLKNYINDNLDIKIL